MEISTIYGEEKGWEMCLKLEIRMSHEQSIIQQVV